MVNNKKAISPVVATALLLVVAVVAVVGFQSWFQTYQSGINAKVEQQSNAGAAVTIERVEQDGTIYLKNADTANNVTISSMEIKDDSGSVVCATSNYSFFSDLAPGVQNVTPSSSCTGTMPAKDGVVGVVVVSESGVVSGDFIVR